jgi:hypothetical protein
MTAKPEKTADDQKEKEIVFKCKFCGETKPLSDLTVMRQFYPQISACRACAKKSPKPEQSEQNS